MSENLRELLADTDGIVIRVPAPLDGAQLELMHALGVTVIVDAAAEAPCWCEVCELGMARLADSRVYGAPLPARPRHRLRRRLSDRQASPSARPSPA